MYRPRYLKEQRERRQRLYVYQGNKSNFEILMKDVHDKMKSFCFPEITCQLKLPVIPYLPPMFDANTIIDVKPPNFPKYTYEFVGQIGGETLTRFRKG